MTTTKRETQHTPGPSEAMLGGFNDEVTLLYYDEHDNSLIAAAPDLLAALTRLLDIAEDQTGVRADTDEGEMAAAQRDARTAIAKARGGAA